VPASRLRSILMPVSPGTKVGYLVNLVSVPQDPDAALTNNKVLPEQGGSPLASLLMLVANGEEEDQGRVLIFQTIIQLQLLVRCRMYGTHSSTWFNHQNCTTGFYILTSYPL
jgi:hypothetical protein